MLKGVICIDKCHFRMETKYLSVKLPKTGEEMTALIPMVKATIWHRCTIGKCNGRITTFIKVTFMIIHE